MKFLATAFVAALATANRDPQLVRELAFAEQAVSKQLLQDHAPEQLLNQEAALLKQAESAVHGGKASERVASFLSAGAQSRSGTAAALAAKVTHEIEFAEKATEVQLKQDHAPAALMQEEKDLLAKALNAARDGQSMMSKIVASEHREKTIEKKLETMHAATRVKTAVSAQELAAATQSLVNADANRVLETMDVENETKDLLQKAQLNATMQKRVADLLSMVEHEERKELKSAKDTQSSEARLQTELAAHAARASVSASTKTAAQMFRSMASEEASVEKDDISNLEAVHAVQSQAANALQEMHASPEEQQKVANLLRTLEGASKQIVSTEEDSVQTTRRLAAGLNLRSQTHKEKSVTNLETENSALREENLKLKREHAQLVHKQELVQENAALSKENMALRSENLQLKQQLTAAP